MRLLFLKTVWFINAVFVLFDANLGLGQEGSLGGNPKEAVAWLNTLIIEENLALDLNEANQSSRLFTNTYADGRTWADTIANSIIQSEDVGYCEAAISLLLRQSDFLADKVNLTSNVLKKGRYRHLRLQYLKLANTLLEEYGKLIRGETRITDNLSQDTKNIPDIEFADVVRLHRIAGSASLNALSGDFRGRLSGELRLPGFGNNFIVPNLSFDSQGNLDLSAYGETVIPPSGRNQIKVISSKRHPITLHIDNSGSYSINGNVRLQFPDGNQVESFISIEDPIYKFGLAYSGTEVFELANQLSIKFPVLDISQVNIDSNELITAYTLLCSNFASCVDSMAKVAEEFPSPFDLKYGHPPEFTAPETVIATDVLNAWVVGLINANLRSKLNLAIQEKNKLTNSIKGEIQKLKGNVVKLKNESESSLARAKAINQINDLNDKISMILGEEALRQYFGDEELQGYSEEVIGISAESVLLSKSNLENAPDLKTGFASLNGYLDSLAINAHMGGNQDIESEFIIEQLDRLTDEFLQQYGVNLTGQILDNNKVDAWIQDDCLVLINLWWRLSGKYSDHNNGVLLDTGLLQVAIKRLYSISKSKYEKSIEDKNLENRALSADFLAHCKHLFQIFAIAATDDEAALMERAWFETYEALERPYAGALANSFGAADMMESANRNLNVRIEYAERRVTEILSIDDNKNNLKRFVQQDLRSQASSMNLNGFWDPLLALFDGVDNTNITQSQKAITRDYAISMVRKNEVKLDEFQTSNADLEDGLIRLNRLINLLNLCEKLLPQEASLIEELKTSWEATHIKWTAAAEVQKGYWYLQRYIDLSLNSFRVFGTELSLTTKTLLETTTKNSLSALYSIASGLSSLLPVIRDENLDFAMPGDMHLRSLYGEVEFDRSNFDWNLKLGGRLEFPEINAALGVPYASVDNEGRFKLSLNSQIDDIFGLDPNFGLSFAIPSNSGPPFSGQLPFVKNYISPNGVDYYSPNIDSFSSEGTLLDRANGVIYTMKLEYDSDLNGDGIAPDGHRFKVSTQATGNYSILTPHVRIFSGGLGFEVQTELDGSPKQTSLEFETSIGLFLEENAAGKDESLLSPSDYSVSFNGKASFVTDLESGIAEIKLNSGRLYLSADQFENNGARPSITLIDPICIKIDPNDEETPIDWCDQYGNATSLAFNNFRYNLGGEDYINFEISHAELIVTRGFKPVLTKVSGGIDLPIENNLQSRNRINFSNFEFDFDGLPSGTITLVDDLNIYQSDLFSILVAGESSCGENQANNQIPSGVTILNNEDNGFPEIYIRGGVRVKFGESLLSIDGNTSSDVVYVADDNTSTTELLTCGLITINWDVDLGLKFNFGLNKLEFAIQSLNVGGPNGLRIDNASIDLSGINSLLSKSDSTDLEVGLSGKIGIDGLPHLDLQNAGFLFSKDGTVKFRTPSNISLESSQPLTVFDGFDVNVEQIGFSFAEANLNMPQLVLPPNLKIEITASAQFGVEPLLVGGRVDGLEIQVVDGTPRVVFDGIGLNIEGLQIDPLNVGGFVYLNGIGPNNETKDFYFAGRLFGKVFDTGVSASVALTPERILGICLDVNAGPAGVPLGPTTLLVTGATGGILFGSNNQDPCHFLERFPDNSSHILPRSIYTLPDSNQVPHEHYGMTWEEAAAQIQKRLDRENLNNELLKSQIIAENESRLPAMQVSNFGLLQETSNDPLDIPCPTGNCPPPSVNILCQPHPDQEQFPNKVIIKYSSFEPEQTSSILDDVGLTKETIEDLGVASSSSISHNISDAIRNFLEGVIPTVPDGLVGIDGSNLSAKLMAERDNLLADIQESFRLSIHNIISDLTGDEDVYAAILSAAYSGLPCPDVALSLKGHFTQALVSTFLTVKGGGVLSSAGSVGLVGDLNLVGIPLGQFKGYATGTDSQGLPNPAFCGEMNAKIGPISASQAKMVFNCENCITGFMDSFAGLVQCGIDNINIDTAIKEILAKVAPEHVDIALNELPSVLTIDQQTAFFAELFAHPVEIPNFNECFTNALLTAINVVDPIFQACLTGPKVFGIPVGHTKSIKVHATKERLEGEGIISPINLAFGSLAPTLDEATISFSTEAFPIDDLIGGAINGDFATAEDYLSFVGNGFNKVLTQTKFGLGYKFSPLGMPLLEGEARIILPDLINHPSLPLSQWEGPPEYFDPNLPTRSQILTAAQKNNLLANVLWKGTTEELQSLFTERNSKTALEGKTLEGSYFPHGGIVAAGELSLPSILANSPPANLGEIFEGETNVIEKVGLLKTFIEDYLLATVSIGEIATYVPAPNPPLALQAASQTISPQEMLFAILDFDPLSNLQDNLYPYRWAFLEGSLNGSILGIPVAEGTLKAYPPIKDLNRNGYFIGNFTIPNDSIFESYLGNAEVNFTVNQTFENDFVKFFNTQIELLEEYMQDYSGNESDLLNFLNNIYYNIVQYIPKISVNANIEDLKLLTMFSEYLQPLAEASFKLSAFSAFFDNDPDADDPLGDVKKSGGMALQGSLNIMNIVDIDSATFKLGLADLGGIDFISGGGDIKTFTFPPRKFGNQESLPLFQLLSIEEQSNISSSFYLDKQGDAKISVDPLEVQSPFLMGSRVIRLYGGSPMEPFTFNSKGPWETSVEIAGATIISFPDERPAIKFGSDSDVIFGKLRGNGYSDWGLEFQLSSSPRITIFPDSPNLEQVIDFDTETEIILRVTSDGGFEFQGSFSQGIDLSQYGIPVKSLSKKTGVKINSLGVEIFGEFQPGFVLNSLGIPNFSGSFMLSSQGRIDSAISFTWPKTSLPIKYGVFELDSPTENQDLTLELSNNSFATGGVVLRVVGNDNNVFELNHLTIGPGGLSAAGSNQKLQFPGYFNITDSDFEFSILQDNASLSFNSPSLTIFPGTPFEKEITSPIDSLNIDSSGRFYLDAGYNSIPLPGGFSGHGRLEIGFESEDSVSALTSSQGEVDFGDVDVGKYSTSLLTVSNAGENTLICNAATIDSNLVYSLAPDMFTLAPGESKEMSIVFYPKDIKTYTGRLNILTQLNENLSVQLIGKGHGAPKTHISRIKDSKIGSIPIGDSASESVYITNIGAEELSINIDSPPSGFNSSLSKLHIDSMQTEELIITHTPIEGGETKANINMQTNDSIGYSTLSYQTTPVYNRFVNRWKLPNFIPSLHVVDPMSSWILDRNGSVYRPTNSGRSWDKVIIRNNDILNSVSFSQDRNYGLLVGASGQIFESFDGGKVWDRAKGIQQDHSQIDWVKSLALKIDNKDLDIVVGCHRSNNEIYLLRRPEIDNWENVQLNIKGEILQVNALNQHLGLLVKDNDQVSKLYILDLSSPKYDLTQINTPSDIAIRSFAASGDTVYIVGDNGKAYSSSLVNVKWLKLNNIEFKGDLKHVIAKGRNIFISNNSGIIYSNQRNGIDWNEQFNSQVSEILSISFLENEVVLLDANGSIISDTFDSMNDQLITTGLEKIDFGSISIGETVFETIQIKNNGIRRETIRVNTDDLGDFAIAGIEEEYILNAGETLELKVGYQSKMLGLDTGKIQFSHENQYLFDISFSVDVRSEFLKSIPFEYREDIISIEFYDDFVGYCITPKHALKSTNGGASWIDLELGQPIEFSGFVQQNQENVIIYGNEKGDNDGFIPIIFRSSNGGRDWEKILPGFPGSINDLVIPEPLPGFSNFIYALVNNNSEENFGGGGKLYKSVNKGQSWVEIPIQQFLFSGNGALHVSDSLGSILISENNYLLSSIDGGNSWDTVLQLKDDQVIKEIHFIDHSTGFVIGDNGAFYTTTTSGVRKDSWYSVPLEFKGEYSSISSNQSGDIWVVGSEIGLNSYTNKIFYSNDNGSSWNNYFSGNKYWINAVGVSANSNVVFAGNNGTILRRIVKSMPKAGFLFGPDKIHLGSGLSLDRVLKKIEYKNLGNFPITVENYRLKSESHKDAFAILGVDTSVIQPGGSAFILLAFEPKTFGDFSCEIQILTNSYNSLLESKIFANVKTRPNLLVFDTSPSGLEISVNGLSRKTPFAYTVDEYGIFENSIKPGTLLAIEAPSNIITNANLHQFVNWSPSSTKEFVYSVKNETKRFVAEYVSQFVQHPENKNEEKTPNDYDHLNGSSGLANNFKPAINITSKPPKGPWLRFSSGIDASPAIIGHPIFGEFELSLYSYLSANEFHISLNSKPLSFPPNSIQGNEWIFVDPGSLLLNYNVSDGLNLQASSGLSRILGQITNAGMSLDINFDPNTGDFVASSNVLADTPLMGGIGEIGAGSSITIQNSEDSLGLGINGRLRMFPDMVGGYLYDEQQDLQINDANFILNFPLNFDFSSWPTLIDANPSSSTFTLDRNNGIFSVDLNDVSLTIGDHSSPPISLSFSTDGNIKYVWESGNFNLVPWLQLQTDNDSIFSHNLFSGTTSFRFGGGNLVFLGMPHWDPSGFTVPELTFDSSPFELEFQLDGFEFGGLNFNDTHSIDTTQSLPKFQLRSNQYGRFSAEIHGFAREQNPLFQAELEAFFSVDDVGTSSYINAQIGTEYLSIADARLNYNSASPNFFQGFFSVPFLNVPGKVVLGVDPSICIPCEVDEACP